MAEYETILVATDFSDRSLVAARRAVDLADRLGSELILAYVVDDRLSAMIFAAASETPEALLERHRRHAEEQLTAFAQEHFPQRRVQSLVRVGRPHARIVELAAERDVDLIVVGTHGHGFVGHVLMGSTAERIVHHAPCPVMVVRSPSS